MSALPSLKTASVALNSSLCVFVPPTIESILRLASSVPSETSTAKLLIVAKIVASQKAYAKRVMKYLLMNQPNYKLAYENEFGPIGKVKI